MFDRVLGAPGEDSEAAFNGEHASVGDMARRDEDGYIHLVDRKSNMIITGGENVYPSEVEGIIGAHPKIKDVAVVGLADEKWGERVHAAVVLREGATMTESDVFRMVQGTPRSIQASAQLYFCRGRRDAAKRDR